MSWAHSKKFRWQAHAMFRHLVKQEKKWREIVEAKVKTYTPEEIIAFAREKGHSVAPSVIEAAAKAKPNARAA